MPVNGLLMCVHLSRETMCMHTYVNMFINAHFVYMAILRYLDLLLLVSYKKYSIGYMVKTVFSFVINHFTGNLQFI